VLGIFRTNQLAANLLLIVYVIILRGSGLFVTQSYEPQSMGIFSEVVYSYVGTNGWLSQLFAIVLVLLQALLLNVLAARFRVSKEVTMFPGVFYILLMSTVPEFFNLSPVLMGNTFLILAISSLFNAYKKSSMADSIFNVGLWIGIASLFYFSNFIFFFLSIFGLATIRSFRFNEFLMVWIGGIVALFIGGTTMFLTKDLSYFFQTTFVESFGFFDLQIGKVWSNYIPLILYGFLVLLAFLSAGVYSQRQHIRSQKNVRILYYFILLTFLTIFIQKGIRIEQLQLLAIPLSLLLPLNFLSFGKKEIANGLHWIWLIGVLFLQYRLLFM